MAAIGIDATLEALLDCICAGLADSGRPVCSCAATVGTPVISLCCECEAGEGEGELWGNLLRLYRGDNTSGADAAPTKPCAPVRWVAQFSVTVSRCSPVLDERGELPDPDARAAAAAQLHADVAALTRAVNCCPLDEPAYLEQVSVDVDPSGGCSYLMATVRVPVSVAAAANARA